MRRRTTAFIAERLGLWRLLRVIGNDAAVRIDSGAIVDEIHLEGIGQLTARYYRDGEGWTAAFRLTADGVHELEVSHRLAAPTLSDARRAVPLAAAFLAGEPVDDPGASL